MIVIRYACICGNIVSTPPCEKWQSSGGYQIIDRNKEVICGECGQTMTLQVTKVTEETKTEIIRGEMK